MGQISILQNLTLHVDEGQRTQASIKEKVSESEKGFHLQNKDSMGENIRRTLALQMKNPPLGNRGKALMILGSSPRSPTP